MTACIQIHGLQMSFPGCDALRGIDLEIPAGSVFALLGENGAGKTTLIRILTGFLRAQSGTVRVCGLDPLHQSLELRRRIGYVADSPALYEWMRVDEIGWFTAAFYGDAFLENYRELMQRFEVSGTRKIRHLSKGQRAKVALALALAHDPELLILDEPTSGLDPLVRRNFLESMVERAATGRTVLLSSHQIAEVERVADRVAILHEGRIRLVDSLAELKEQTAAVTVTLEDPLVAVPRPAEPCEVLAERVEGRQLRWLVRNFADDHRTALADRPGVTQVQTDRVSLDDLFVACTHGGVSRRGVNRPAGSPTPEAATTP